MDFYEKVKGFILEPSRTFDATKEDTLEDALKYYVGITAIFSAISAVLFAFASTLFGSMMGGFGMMSGAGTGLAGAVLLFVMLLILMVIGAFIGGAIVHIFVYHKSHAKCRRCCGKYLMSVERYNKTMQHVSGLIYKTIGGMCAVSVLIPQGCGLTRLNRKT